MDSPVAIYSGMVRHRRWQPFYHEFRYRLFLVALDLTQLQNAFRGRWFWSANRQALARFRRSDHFGDANVPLDECVRDLVEEETGARPAGRIILLTHLRYFGYIINPISLYYCHDADGKLVALVAEVENTPWRETHCYVIPISSAGRVHRHENPKQFHVSPFLPMDLHYRWVFSNPEFAAADSTSDQALSLHLETARKTDDDESECMLDATLSLRRKPATAWNFAVILARHPLMTIKVAAAIYWQAIRLWWLGATFFTHPKKVPTDSGTTQQV